MQQNPQQPTAKGQGPEPGPRPLPPYQAPPPEWQQPSAQPPAPYSTAQPPQAVPRPRTPVHYIDAGTARALAAVAHGAIAFGLLGVGFLVTLAISGVIWLYGRRSPLVRFHSEQAGCYQCSVLLVNAALILLMGAAGGFSIFSALQGRGDWGVGWLFWVGLVLFLLWFAGTIAYGIIGALLVLAGKPFKYPIIGDRFAADARDAKRSP